jgi:precorrin-6B methylase 2
MNRAIFTIYRILVPKPLRTIILKKNLRIRILNYFDFIPEEEINDDQKEVLRYLEKNPLSTFPYTFQKNYLPENIKVFFDSENGMHYVLFDNKKLYFKKRWSEKRIKKGYSNLMREQDVNSPHRYLTDEFTPNSDDVIADIGAAEGNFSLSVVKKVKKIYIFEYDHEWVQALKATFAPWADKVEIIDKRVADFDDNKHIRFDTFYNKKQDISFLKIDVDGAEEKVLNSCNEIFASGKPLKVALCTYHKNNDEKDFTSLFQKYGFSVSFSKGYMIHYWDKKMKAPYLRRGLIRAIRE